MKSILLLEQLDGLPSDERKALESVMRTEKKRKNELIQPVGSRCQTIYLIRQGSARIFYYRDGRDITEHFAFTNDLIVRAESLFTGQVTSKGIQALDSVELIAIDSTRLFKLYEEYRSIERLFRLIFEQEYVNALKRIEGFQFLNAKERYLELLETTDFVHKIPLKYIASYLGVTQVTLSRIRAEIR